jgi:putative addiction module component (TIGR02574 family)
MPTRVQEIEDEVLQLPVEDRAILAEHLIRSLDVEEDAEVERLWIAEAERRYNEYKAGRAAAQPAALVFEEVRAELGRR